MAGEGTDNALDYMVVVVSGNRSLDSVLGRLYGPGDGKTFKGVTGKDPTNPIPEWAEHGPGRKKVPYTVAADMDSPNPGTEEENPHIIHNFLAIQFPLLHPAAPGPVPRSDPDGTQP
jgi:phospholipase C